MAAASAGEQRKQTNESEGIRRVDFRDSPFSLIIHHLGDKENFLSYIGSDYVAANGNPIVGFIGQTLVRLIRKDDKTATAPTLAFLTVTITDSVIEIYDVSRRHSIGKGTNIGKTLIQLTVSELRVVSENPIWLGTVPSPLVAFYRGCGFAPCESSFHRISPLGYYSDTPFTSMFFDDASHPNRLIGVEKCKLHVDLKNLKVYQTRGVILEPSFTEEALTHISTQIWNSASESALLFYSKKETSDCIWDGQTIKIVEKLDVAIKTEPMIRIGKNKFQYMPLSPPPCVELSGKLIRGHTHNALLYRLIGGADYYCGPPSSDDYVSAIIAKDPVHLVFAAEGVYAININLSKTPEELTTFLSKYNDILKFFVNGGEIYRITNDSEREIFAEHLQTVFTEFRFGSVKTIFSNLFGLTIVSQPQRSNFAIRFLEQIFQHLGEQEGDFFVKITFFNYTMSAKRKIIAINGIEAYSTNPSSILNAGNESINSNRCFIDLTANNINRYKAEINIGSFYSEKTGIYQCFKPFECVSIPVVEYIRLRVSIPTSDKQRVYYFPDKLSLEFYLKQIILNLKSESLSEITIENDNALRLLQLNDVRSVVFRKLKLNIHAYTISIDNSSPIDFPTTAILTQTTQPTVTATLSNGSEKSFELPIRVRHILDAWIEDLPSIPVPITISFDKDVSLKRSLTVSSTPLKTNKHITFLREKGKFTHFTIQGDSSNFPIDSFYVIPMERFAGSFALTAPATSASAGVYPAGATSASAGVYPAGATSASAGVYPVGVHPAGASATSASAGVYPVGVHPAGASATSASVGGAGIRYLYYNKERQELGAASTGLPTSIRNLKTKHPEAKYIVFTNDNVKLSSTTGLTDIPKNSPIDLTVYTNDTTIASSPHMLMGWGRRTLRRRLAKKQKSRKNQKKLK